MDLLATGQIRGAFGVNGFVKVESFSGEYEHFLRFTEVFLSIPKGKSKEKEPKQDRFEVEEIKIRSADALLKFKGIDSPEAAKLLTGSEVFIPRDMAPPLNEGEVYVRDLCNCNLVYKGTLVGKITSVVEGGGGYLLEISEAAAAVPVYVPFNKEFIGTIDIEAGTAELMHRWILE